MENPTPTIQMRSKEALLSAISKSRKALIQMSGKGANTALIERRLKALEIGLSALSQSWDGRPVSYSLQELAESRAILNGLMPAIEKAYAQSKPGSPQKTLLRRRLRALDLAMQAIDMYSSGHDSVK